MFFTYHIPSIVRIGFGREKVGVRVDRGFCRRVVDVPDAFPPGFRLLFVHSSLAAFSAEIPPDIRRNDVEAPSFVIGLQLEEAAAPGGDQS